MKQKKARLGVVRDLWTKKYSMKVKPAKKGKTAYNRKKLKQEDDNGNFQV